MATASKPTVSRAEKLAALGQTSGEAADKLEAAKADGSVVEPAGAFPPAADDAERVAAEQAEAKAKAEAEEVAKAEAAAAAAKAEEAAHAAELDRAVDFGGNVPARVTFGRYAATVNGRYVVAERGQLVKGSAAFVARGVKLKGLEEV